MQRLKAFGLRLLAVWREKIQNSEEGDEESKFILLLVVVTKQ